MTLSLSIQLDSKKNNSSLSASPSWRESYIKHIEKQSTVRTYGKANKFNDEPLKFSDGSVRQQLSVGRKDFGPSPNRFCNCDQRYKSCQMGPALIYKTTKHDKFCSRKMNYHEEKSSAPWNSNVGH